MSFPQQERIFEVIEPLVQRVCEVAGYKVDAPFARLTYAERCVTTAATTGPPRSSDAAGGRPARRVDRHGLPLLAIHLPGTARPAARSATS
jgi:aspartyl-tRNA synthetase